MSQGKGHIQGKDPSRQQANGNKHAQFDPQDLLRRPIHNSIPENRRKIPPELDQVNP